jgi:hypothetical protein
MVQDGFDLEKRDKVKVELLKRFIEDVESPDRKRLAELGIEIVSSDRQLKNGTIVLGYPGYNSRLNFALGIFSSTGVIRRIMPKGGMVTSLDVPTSYYGNLDRSIADLRSVPQEDFYCVALRWILDNIDFKATTRDRFDIPWFPTIKNSKRGLTGTRRLL